MPAPKPGTIALKRTGGILADGVYQFRVESVEEKAGQKTNYLALRHRQVKGSGTVFDNIMLNDSSRWRMEAFLDAISAPTEGNMTYSQLRGKTFWAKVGNESYKGRLKNTIEAYLTEDMAAQERQLSETMEEASHRIMGGFGEDGASEDGEEEFPAISPGQLGDYEESEKFPV